MVCVVTLLHSVVPCNVVMRVRNSYDIVSRNPLRMTWVQNRTIKKKKNKRRRTKEEEQKKKKEEKRRIKKKTKKKKKNKKKKKKN